jgi:sugar/nucleoside kinase (ribokinase family)
MSIILTKYKEKMERESEKKMESKSEQQKKFFEYKCFFTGHVSRDLTIPCTTQILQKLGIKQNDTNKYTETLIQELYNEIGLSHISKEPGGSMFNTAKNFSTLFKSQNSTEKIAFTGFVPPTEDGEMARQSLEESGVTLLFDYNKYLLLDPNNNKNPEIATILCLIDEEEKDRTFIIHQDQGLSVEFIDIEALRDSEFFMCSGYACQDVFVTTNEDGTKKYEKFFIDGIEYLFREAKKNETKTIFSLSAPQCIDEHGDKFRQFIDDGLIDIVFGNENEIKCLCEGYQTEELKQNINELLTEKSRNTTIVMTRGPKNPRIYHDGEMEEVEIHGLLQGEIVNTNGAGDAFASGFLYGLSQGLEYKECTELGHLISLGVLMQEGTALSERLAKQITTIYLRKKRYSQSTVDLVKEMVLNEYSYYNGSEEKEPNRTIQLTCRQEASRTQLPPQPSELTEENKVRT